MTRKVLEYLRFDDRFPTIWCPGCGNGVVMRAIIEAVIDLKLDKDNIAVISGIGCVSRMPGYLDFNTLHIMHGRALPAATGVKLARPDLNVIVVMGDGDALAIGGNHLIHAARRNLDLTAIIVNNFIYGMTGGQVSPSTPQGSFTTTSPYGDFEREFDACKLMEASGAVFVARTTVYHVMQLIKFIRQAISKKGFSVVEVISNCHVLYGRYNKLGGAVEMLNWIKEKTVPLTQAKTKAPEKLRRKIITGVFHEAEAEEYTDNYRAKFSGVKLEV